MASGNDMAQDLKQIHERLEFCEELIAEVERHLTAFQQRFVETKFEKNGPNTWAYARIKSDLPISLTTRAGLTANEIRSCLDALAWVLAVERNATDPAKRIYFPISQNEQKLLNRFARGGDLHQAFSAADEQTLIGFQPYDGGNQILFQMSQADNLRKHRKSLVVSVQGSISPTGSGYIGVMLNTMELLTEPDVWHQIGMYNNTTTPTKIRSELHYNEPGLLQGVGVAQALRTFLAEAGNIVSAFD